MPQIYLSACLLKSHAVTFTNQAWKPGINMSYDEILKEDAQEYASWEFDWNCEKCYKSLCLRIVAIANFPSKYDSFKMVAFENNKDGKDYIMVVMGDVEGAENVLARTGKTSCLNPSRLQGFFQDF
jgi:hypothetical protein